MIMKRITFTKHAKSMCLLRGLSEKILINAVRKPDLVLPAKENKQAYLKNLGKNYLKIIIFKDTDTLVIITAYWIAKERVKQ